MTSGRNASLVRSLGADEVFDYAREDVAAGGPRYDVIFGAVNGLPLRSWRRALRPEGNIVTVNPLFGNGAVQRLVKTFGRARVTGVFVRPDGADLGVLGRWISIGELRPVIDRSYPLTEAVAAHRYSETRRARGKLVLVVDEGLAATRADSVQRFHSAVTGREANYG